MDATILVTQAVTIDDHFSLIGMLHIDKWFIFRLAN